MFLVTKRPKAVTRKLAIEIWFLSKGQYQGTGESSATSLSQTTLCSKRGKTIKVLTSKPASLSASMHSPVDLISGSPLPSSTSFCFEPPLSRGDKGGSNGFPGGESLHGHGSVAAVAGVADGEGEGVAPVGACSDDLGNGGFSPAD
nr:hypothetical protein PanWU01x14_050790 [Ipomoea batatas]